MGFRNPAFRGALIAGCLLTLPATLSLADWTQWRGVDQRGVSAESGLVDTWSPEGENLLWHSDLITRSTPVVIGDRVCANGRVGEGIDRQARVACYDVASGKLLWEDRFNVYNSTVPFNRVGWASMAADAETGYVYAHGVAGQLIAYAPDGKRVWTRMLMEEVGHLSGYGGRTQTPIVDGDQLLMSFVSSNWGPTAPFRHRMYSFDKRTGALNWVSTPGGLPFDANTQSAPVIAEVNGQRAILFGNADGHIHAIQAHTGQSIWKFQLSKRGINSTVLYHDGMVYASHSEENIDEPVMGRIVAFKADGTGDITQSNEVWRITEHQAGFPSPAFKDGVLYHVDNSANLMAIDGKTGTVKWTYSLGTVGKSSPVIADGKIYGLETNGRVHILKLNGDKEPTSLDFEELEVEGGRYAEIYGSVAVSDGRVFIPSEAGLYAIGDKSKNGKSGKSKYIAPKVAKGSGPVATLLVQPAEALMHPGQSAEFSVQAFDAKGLPLAEPKNVTWSVAGPKGKVSKGKFTAAADNGFSGGKLVAKVGDVEGFASLRIAPPLPWSLDFENYDEGDVVPGMVGAPTKYVIKEIDGNKVLTKVKRPRGVQRTFSFFGPSTWNNYRFQADVMGNFEKRRKTDAAIINAGYVLDLQGNQKNLQVRAWPSENRIATNVPFEWEMQTWYTLVLEVEQKADKALIRGKVWKKGEPEPADWTIEVVDPHPIPAGAPGFIGYSPADLYYDNLKISEIK